MELYFCMGYRGCGHFVSLSVCRRGTIVLAVMKSPDNSDSEAEDMTTLIIWAWEKYNAIFAGDRVIVRACMGYWGCGHFVSLSVCRRGTIVLAVMKSPDNSDSEDEDMTTLIIWARERTGPLSRGVGSFSEQKI